MTIEEIRIALDALITDKTIVTELMDSIVQIRFFLLLLFEPSDAYNEGWDDAEDDNA